MAYNDYGAFVYCNGERRRDKEDAPLIDTEEDYSQMASGSKIYANLIALQNKSSDDFEFSWLEHIHHGIMGDGPIRVLCHKQGLPEIYDLSSDKPEQVKYCPEDTDPYEYGIINYEYKGYTFNFRAEKPYVAYMEEPNGTWWRCEYDYGFGAGFEDN